jgi:hypothetical protein
MTLRSKSEPSAETPETTPTEHFGAQRGASVNKILISWYKDLLLFDVSYCVRVYHS